MTVMYIAVYRKIAAVAAAADDANDDIADIYHFTTTSPLAPVNCH